MKKLLLAALLYTGLAGCSKKDPDPTPPPTPMTRIAGKWALVSEVTIKTPKQSGASPTVLKNITFNNIFYAFGNDGKVTITESGTTSIVSYTFDGTTLTYLGTNVLAEQVTTLTTNQLIMVESHSDSQATYVTTDTYSR
jgi:hypothetical protein